MLILKKIGLGIFLTFLVYTTNVPPFILIAHQNDMSDHIKWLVLFVYIAYLCFIVRMLWKKYRNLVPESLLKQKVGWLDMLILFGYFMIMKVLVIVFSYLNLKFSGQSVTANDNALLSLKERMMHGFLPFTILMILLVVVIAPIVEELIFRGLFSRWLMPKSVVWIRATVSSFIIVVLHAVKPLEILMYTMLGLGIYMLY